jgi:hypothetical protein
VDINKLSVLEGTHLGPLMSRLSVELIAH